jgi:DNA-directed RNA polymerase specialized sigma24 family protein
MFVLLCRPKACDEDWVMKRDWALTQDAFDSLLNWLDADRERAATKYEAIRLRLIKIFICRRCSEAEELADETINRVAARVKEIIKEYQGDPARYFYGVCQKVHLEYLRKANLQRDLESAPTLQSASAAEEDIESEYECLERCLGRLPSASRELVIKYYQQERQAKIEHRRLLATELGIAVNALRIRAHRIRLTLQECVKDCVAQQPVH